MSRTYGTKHDFNKNYGNVEYPNGLKKEYPYGIESREPNVEYDEVDMTHTTCSPDAYQLTTRHPNKKKHHSLNREFGKNGLPNISNWKSRYGESPDKSSRNHLVRREIAQIRRRKIKRETKKIIEESI